MAATYTVCATSGALGAVVSADALGATMTVRYGGRVLRVVALPSAEVPTAEAAEAWLRRPYGNRSFLAHVEAACAAGRLQGGA